MTKKNIVDINAKKIVLTNGEINLFANRMSQQSKSFLKIVTNSVVSGKFQYWVFRLQTKMISLWETVDKVCSGLVKKYADKDESGEMLYTDSHPIIDPEKQQEYEEKIKELNLEPNSVSEEVKSEFYKKTKKGKLVLVGGTQPQLSPNNFVLFSNEFQEVLNEENVLPFDRIQFPSELLEKMNQYIIDTAKEGKEPDVVTTNDMMALEKIFDFVE